MLVSLLPFGGDIPAGIHPRERNPIRRNAVKCNPVWRHTLRVSTGAFPTNTTTLAAQDSIARLVARSVNPNLLSRLADILVAPLLWCVNLLSSLPDLIVGLSN